VGNGRERNGVVIGGDMIVAMGDADKVLDAIDGAPKRTLVVVIIIVIVEISQRTGCLMCEYICIHT
jgi:hypothetical protein